MEANNFVTKIKANGRDTDQLDLDDVFMEYKDLLLKLPQKDKGTFSLNVLLVLCRNLSKIPTWRDKIDNKKLLAMSIECIRHTRTLDKLDQTKILACIYHIHKHVIKVKSPIPPELILKLSFMPFEGEDLLAAHCKTYWSILADRLTYIEKLKTLKMPISKLLPKFTEDIVRIIKMYDTKEFCSNLLQTLVKKLNSIFNDSCKELNETFGKIFNCISKKDLKTFSVLMDKDAVDLYVKLNDILCIVTENSLRNNFKHSVLDDVTRTCISILRHRTDMFHCLQTFYLNSFSCIFKDRSNQPITDSCLTNILISCEVTEKLGYVHVMYSTYPFLSQLLRLYIENVINNQKDCAFFNETQEVCLKLILLLVKKLKNCNQSLKCENCKVKSGLHDALRLSFVIKHFITISTNNEIEINYLPLYYTLVEEQYNILNELKTLGCFNHEKCFRKLQTDIHNTAITLNRCKSHEYSIKLFEIYIVNEVKNIKNDADLKNISRASYNKSICELDTQLFDQSLRNAYLSLIFSLPEGLESEKYMSLVIDIKSKSLKGEMEEEKSNELRMVTILEVCNMLYNDNVYGNLKPFLKTIKFSNLLIHEFSMYIKLWPSVYPVSGVCKSLYNLLMNKPNWINDENNDVLLWMLIEKVLEIPTVVRSIQIDCYKDIVNSVLKIFEGNNAKTIQEKVVYATILFLKSDFAIAEASEKYEWKKKEQSLDPDQMQITRTVEQEYNALKNAFKAVHILIDVLPLLKSEIPSKLVEISLQIWQVFVQQFLFMQRMVYGLQLALICCDVAEFCGNKEIYVRNASVLINHANKSKEFNNIVQTGTKYSTELMKSTLTLDVALCFICDIAIYYLKKGCTGISAKLVQYVQTQILLTQHNQPEINLQLALGRLMNAQYILKPDSGQSMLSSLNGLQRHYLLLPNDCTSRWSQRLTNTLITQNYTTNTTIATTRVCRQLRILRRAVTASRPLSRLSAISIARIYGELVNTNADDAQIKIETRLKYLIGIQTTSTQTSTQKQQQFTPKRINFEPVRDAMLERAQISPISLCMSIPEFKTPEFITHETCSCHVCDPACVIIACHTCYLESSTFYRLKDFDIARNYFTGTLKMFENAEAKLKNIFFNYRKVFDSAIVEIVENFYINYYKEVQIEFLLELSYFELSQNYYEKTDGYIIRIHEVISENKDIYLYNDFHNLIIASAQIRKTITKPKETGMENELENLKLSPPHKFDIQKTPETKIKPKIGTSKVVKDEEVPKKYKSIKPLKFDEDIEENVVKTKKLRSQFKIPVAITMNPVLENITPKPTRSKPTITIQTPSIHDNADVEKSEFFTPHQSTPSDQFFTPIMSSSLKTYSKRIVKNLESDFSTPKENCKKVETGSIKTLKDRRGLKKATSPGKLVEEKPVTRTRRIRQPILRDD